MKEVSVILSELWNRSNENEEDVQLCFEYLKTFSKILNFKPSSSFPRKFIYNDEIQLRYNSISAELCDEFESAAGNSFTNVFRSIGVSERLAYKETLLDCASELGLKMSKNISIKKMDEKICEVFFDGIWEKIDDKTKETIIESILKEEKNKDKEKDLKKALLSGAPFAAVVAGNLGGFSSYLMATTALHTISSVLGISLGFSTYMGLSGALSVALGPIGFVLSSAWAAYSFSSPSYKKKIIPCVILFFTMRKHAEIL